jgi:hypothetical protein
MEFFGVLNERDFWPSNSKKRKNKKTLDERNGESTGEERGFPASYSISARHRTASLTYMSRTACIDWY